MGIGQNNHLVSHFLDQRLKVSIILIGGAEIPINNQAKLVQQQTEFAAHNPALIRQPLFADLLLTPSFSDRVDQFDPVTVNHPQEGWFSQKAGGQPSLAHKQPEQAAAMGQIWKFSLPVFLQPPIEGSTVATLEGKENGDRHDLTGMQFKLKSI